MTRMKDSGIEWIGEVPEEWGITKFKYFLDTNKGLTITKDNLIEDGIPVINYGQIHSKYGKSVSTDRDELPKVSANYLKFKQSLLKPGDFVFADTSEDVDGSGNFSTRIDDNGELFAGYHTIKAKLKNALEHDFRYFMHYFDSLAFRKQVQNKVSGIKVYSITQTILQETCLIVPSLYEQNQIADFLDKKVAQLDKVKSLLEEQIKTLEDYRQSLIYETVTKGLDKTVPLKDSGVDWIGQIPEGWGVKSIKHIFDVIGSGTTPDSSKTEYYDGDINWLQSGDLYKTDYVDSVSKTITELGYLSSASLKIYEAPFLAIAMYGASIGNLAISKIDACVNQAVVVLKGKEDTVRFVKFGLEISKSELIFAAQGGTQPNINQVLIKNWLIPFPGEIEIREIADFLDKKTEQINQMIAIKKEQIENINKQRQTLIYDYVTGKRRV